MNTDRVKQVLTSTRAEKTYGVIGGTAALTAAFMITHRLFGAIDAMIYWGLFIAAASSIPFLILLFGGNFPGAATLGKFHIVLTQAAFGRGVLVQHQDRWEWCPATEDHVWIDEHWHEIESGQTNWSVLGWFPFAVARYKNEETLRESRVDPANMTATDGGVMHRFAYPEIAPSESDVPDDGYLVDLSRVFSRGLQEIGDTKIIEEAEEVTERNEHKSSLTSGWEPIVATAIGLALGIGTTYMLM